METNSYPVSDRYLPHELECTIFEVAALARPTAIPTLLLIARRVKEWVEPLLYRVVVLSSFDSDSELHGYPITTAAILLRVIATKPAGFLENSVKHFFVSRGPVQASELQTIFTACNRVTNLFDSYTFASAAHLGVLGTLRHLQRLALPLDEFLHCCSLEGTHSMLANLTHLELLRTGQQPRMESVCAHLPLLSRLTHFAINSISHHHPTPNGAPRQRHAPVHPVLDDSRFGTDKGKDFWALADAFVAGSRTPYTTTLLSKKSKSSGSNHLYSAISTADRRAAALDVGTAEDDDEWEDVDDGLRGAHPFLNGVIYPDA
ncbi:hypothetical protein B0H19DRAFT_1275737 [Mycena capillaripes]|nr:hypothetical protein B0H19DRAFT_1275737 [Mycena capillaripes]